MRRRIAAAAMAVGVLLTTAGCHDDTRTCLHSHSEMELIPISTGKSVSLVPYMAEVCDTWAAPTQTPSR
jgi:hypothetical protein